MATIKVVFRQNQESGHFIQNRKFSAQQDIETGELEHFVLSLFEE